jgi:hypothetical protein
MVQAGVSAWIWGSLKVSKVVNFGLLYGGELKGFNLTP